MRFQVKWDSAVMSFEEVAGLDVEPSSIKMPGLNKAGNLTMKRGVFTSRNRFWDWFNQLKTKHVPLTISLLDAGGTPTRVWTLRNPRPTKVTGPDLNAGGNEVAIETIEIAHEGLTLDTTSP